MGKRKKRSGSFGREVARAYDWLQKEEATMHLPLTVRNQAHLAVKAIRRYTAIRPSQTISGVCRCCGASGDLIRVRTRNKRVIITCFYCGAIVRRAFPQMKRKEHIT